MDTILDFDNNELILNMIVNKGELPRYIYKYASIETLTLILESSKIKFSKPSEFNDPFDCNISIDTNNTIEEIDDYIKFLKHNHNLTDDQEKSIRQKFHNPDELYAITNRSIKETKEKFGVTCFSKNANNLLMWAHYADKHKGVCMKFDILSDTDFFMTPFPVIYKKDYPIYNYFRNRDGLGKFLLETKSKDWKYEREIRVMKEGSSLYEFKKNSLVEIIFGARSLAADRREIIHLAKARSFSSIDYKICIISNSKFKLDITNLDYSE